MNRRPSLFKFCLCLPIREQFFQNQIWKKWAHSFLIDQYFRTYELYWNSSLWRNKYVSNFRNDLSKKLVKCKCNLGQLFLSNFHLVSVCNPSTSMIIKDKYLPFLIAICTLQTSLAKVGGQRSINIGAHPKNSLAAKASNRA